MAVLDKPSHAGGDNGSHPGSWPSAAQHGQGLIQLEHYHAKRQCKRAHFDSPAEERLLLSSSLGSTLGADFWLMQQKQQKPWSPSPLFGSPFGSRAASAPAGDFAPATPPEQQIAYAPTISPQVPLRWGNVAEGPSDAVGPQRDRPSPLSRPAQPVSLLSVALENSVAVKAEIDGPGWNSSRAFSTTPEARSPTLTRTSDGSVEAVDSPRDSAGLQLPCYGSPAGAPLPEAAMAVLMPSAWRRLKGSWKQPAPHDDAPAASSPLRLPAFKLTSSRIWQAGQPHGLPPLPLKRQYTPRTISMVAAANVTKALSRGHYDGDDDCDNDYLYHNPSAASSLSPHPDSVSPTQPPAFATSSNSWRPQASPFATAAQDGDADGAAIPSSCTAAGGTTWHGSWADEEDDEDLDDYYVNKLCGGRDPLAAFMEEERRRSESLSAQLPPQQQEEEEQQQQQEEEHVFPLADEEMLLALRSQELHPSASLSGELEQEAAIARQLAASIAAAAAAAGQRWAGEEVKEEERQQQRHEEEGQEQEVEGGNGDVVVEVLVNVGQQGKGGEPKACVEAVRMEGSEGEGAAFGGLEQQQEQQQGDTEMREVAAEGLAAAVVCAEACDEGAACGCDGSRDCAVQHCMCCHASATSYFKCYYHRVAMEAAAPEGPVEQQGQQPAGHGAAMGMERAGSCVHCRVAADVRDLVSGVVWEAMFGSSYESSMSE